MRWLDSLKKTMGEDKVASSKETCLIYSRDESHIPIREPCAGVIFPEKGEDVEKVLIFAERENIPVTPRGGGTGVSGGAVPYPGGIVLAFDRMQRIIDIDERNLTVTAEPGVILKNLHSEVEKLGLFYPPDPASLENCTIGGNVATNAGGPRALKYGVTKHYILEIEAVFSGGVRKKIGKKTKKWVAGYDLLGLLTGSEGTLGVFTELSFRLIPLPETVQTLLISFSDEISAVMTASEIIENKILPRALEWVDRTVFEKLKHEISANLPSQTTSFLLVELDGEENYVAGDALKIAEIAERNSSLNIFAGTTLREREKLWDVRRRILPAFEKKGFRIRSEDVVVARTKISELVRKTLELEEKYRIPVFMFGHIGDGNLHINFLWKDEDRETLKGAVKELYKEVIEMNGTITGEHGIGILKRKYLSMEQDNFIIEMQRNIKRTIDPKNTLNRGKIFIK